MAIPSGKASIVWGDFSPHLPGAAAAGIAKAVSTDGHALSMSFSGLEVRCGDTGQPRAATMVLAGVQPITLPPRARWSGTLGIVRGAFDGGDGARGNLHIAIGDGSFSRSFTAPVSGDVVDDGFDLPVFSSEGTTEIPRPDGEPVTETLPLTICVLLSVAAPPDRGSALLTVDSIDLSLWLG